MQRIYTDILLKRIINNKTKYLNVAGVRAMNGNFNIAKKFNFCFLDYLKINYAKEGEQLVDRRYKKSFFLIILVNNISQSYITQKKMLLMKLKF